MESEMTLRQQLLETGKRLYEHGLVGSTEGSMSVRLNEREFLCTSSGTNKGMMPPESICKVDIDGNVLRAAPGYKPTAAVKTHLIVYRNRPDVKAVLHVYPHNALSYATIGRSLSAPTPLEALNALGCVPCLPDGLPQTDAQREKLAQYFKAFDAVMFSNIGVLAYGGSLFKACNTAETVELYASLSAKVKALGAPSDPQKTIESMTRRGKIFRSKHPVELCVRRQAGKTCCHCAVCGGSDPAPASAASAAVAPACACSNVSSDDLAEIVRRVMAALPR